MVLIPRQFAIAVYTLLGLAFMVLSGPGTASGQADKPREVSIQIQNAKLRATPNQWAAGQVELHFGDRLTVLAQDGAWLKVKTLKLQEGYIHETATTSRKVVLSNAKVSIADIAVDDSQIYLATKGFNSQVEAGYRQSDPQADYAAVEAMRSNYRVSEERLLKFIEDGKLKKG